MTLYSYVSHLFYPHSLIHNSIIIALGCIAFILKIKKFNFIKKDFLILFGIFFLLFSGLLMSKNHDDFSYYHFPYTYYLTQHSLSFGLGNFGHGFRTPSSIFYLNSLFYLPMAKYYLFNIYFILVIGFTNIILIKKILTIKNRSNKSNITYLHYLSLISLIFINVFFYRLSEHGTDRSAQILIILFIIELLNLNFLKKIKFYDLINIYVISGLIISLKAFFVLYIIFIFPVIYLLKKKSINLIKILQFLFLNNISYLFIILLFFTFLNNFTNTGCIIYPIDFTCIKGLSWGIPIEQVSLMNNWYEQWSKAGAGPNFRIENPHDYISGFNWLDNWISEYFFNKVSDFLLGILVLILIFLLTFNFKDFNFKKIKINTHIKLTYLILFLLFLEWFYNHPALRYGGYAIVTMLIFIPVSLVVSTNNIKFKKYFKNSIILIMLSLLIFNARNSARISSEIKKYNYDLLNTTFYEVSENHFRIENKMNRLIKSYNNCKNNNDDCDISLGKIEIIYGKKIYTNK